MYLRMAGRRDRPCLRCGHRARDCEIAGPRAAKTGRLILQGPHAMDSIRFGRGPGGTRTPPPPRIPMALVRRAKEMLDAEVLIGEKHIKTCLRSYPSVFQDFRAREATPSTAQG